MSRWTLRRLAILGALSLGGMSQTASAQWMPFGGGCNTCEMPVVPTTICGPTCGVACAPPPVVCAPPPPQYVMQPFTETRTVEQVVQRPVCETKMVSVPQTEYRQHMETHTAQVPTTNYQTVCEMQTRQRDCGRWVTNYRCRPQVAPCAYDNRPGLLGALNRFGYSARMAVTPAVVAERTYVPNVITEQIPVTRQVAVPGVRQVTYQVPRTVAYHSTRQVAVQTTRYVAERVPQQVQVTTMRMVPYNESAMALGGAPGYGTAFQPGYPGYGTAWGSPYGGYGGYGSTAVADPRFGGTRTATLPNDSSPPVPIPPRGPNATRPRGLPMNPAGDTLTPAATAPPQPMPPATSEVIPARAPETEDAVEELAQTNAPVRHSAGYRPAPRVETVTSLPSIVRVSQMNFRSPAPRTAEMSVASNSNK
ncbi:MAG: hypothetical protein V4719_10250 [Planctomycetota bacterium]